jgi:RNA-directed DNA polymerase
MSSLVNLFDTKVSDRARPCPRQSLRLRGRSRQSLLANTFLHLAFDEWMRKMHPEVPFERYADDIVAHGKTKEQAHQVLASIKRRLEHCRLEVHPEKTRIVYCKDDDRTGRHPQEKFDFLGYTFRPRRAKNRGGETFRELHFGREQRCGDQDAPGDAALANPLA